MAAKQADDAGPLQKTWDLIARVKSRKSNFDLNCVLLERMRNLKDACDWIESMEADSMDVNVLRARRLVHERLKAAEVQVKKNVEEQLKEPYKVKRQTSPSSKGAVKSKGAGFVNSRLSHPKNQDCERCAKKRSQEKDGGHMDRTSTALSMARRRKCPKNSDLKPQLPHTSADALSTVSTPIKTTRTSMAVQKQLAQSLKEKLKAKSSSLPKVILLSLTQKNNVPTLTKATNTGTSDDDDRVRVENVVHWNEDDTKCGPRQPSRALTVRLLPGVSVPMAKSSAVSPENRGNLSPRVHRPSPDEHFPKNIGRFDLWSVAETGVPEGLLLDDGHEKHAIIRPITPETRINDENDDWLAATRQWLEQELVDVVLSRLEMDESSDLRKETPSSTRSNESLVQPISPSKELQDSNTSIATEDYADTFEDLTVAENSGKDERLTSASESTINLESCVTSSRLCSISEHSQDDSAKIEEVPKTGSSSSLLSPRFNASPLQDQSLESRHDSPKDDLISDHQNSQSKLHLLFEDLHVQEEKNSLQQVDSNVSVSVLSLDTSEASPQARSETDSSLNEIGMDRAKFSSSLDLPLAEKHQQVVRNLESAPNAANLVEGDSDHGRENIQLQSEGNTSMTIVVQEESITRHPEELDCVPKFDLNAKPPTSELVTTNLPDNPEEIGANHSKHEINLSATDACNCKTQEERECKPQGSNCVVSMPKRDVQQKGVNVSITDDLEFANKRLSLGRQASASLLKTFAMDKTASKDLSNRPSTLANEDVVYSVGEVISTRKLRHVAFNRMNRKTRNAEMVSEPSTASTLDGTVTDLESDTDFMGASSSAGWSEGEVRLDPLLGTILCCTHSTKKMSTQTSLGEVSDVFHTSCNSQESPQEVLSETNFDADASDSMGMTSPTEPPTSHTHSLGELD